MISDLLTELDRVTKRHALLIQMCEKVNLNIQDMPVREFMSLVEQLPSGAAAEL